MTSSSGGCTCIDSRRKHHGSAPWRTPRCRSSRSRRSTGCIADTSETLKHKRHSTEHVCWPEATVAHPNNVHRLDTASLLLQAVAAPARRQFKRHIGTMVCRHSAHSVKGTDCDRSGRYGRTDRRTMCNA